LFALGAVGGFFPPVSHMMLTIRMARPMISQDWTFLGKRPGGFGVFSWMDSFMAAPYCAVVVRVKVSFFLPTVRYPLSKTFGTM
jgi:hypothetical protein